MGTLTTRNADLGLGIGCWAPGLPFEGQYFPRVLTLSFYGVKKIWDDWPSESFVNSSFDCVYINDNAWEHKIGVIVCGVIWTVHQTFVTARRVTGDFWFEASFQDRCLLKYDNEILLPGGGMQPNGYCLISWNTNDIS